jgi:hypothetical protein
LTVSIIKLIIAANDRGRRAERAFGDDRVGETGELAP